MDNNTMIFNTILIDHLCLHWGLCLISYIIDTNKLVLKKLPNRTVIPKDILSVVVLNQILVTIPVLYLAAEWFPPGDILELTNLIKLPLTILLTEIIFYYVHRAFHKVKFLIKYHALHHEITGPFTLATFYCHPVEMLAGNIAPFIIAGLLVNLNFQTMRLWHFIAVFNTMINAHGGYQILDSLCSSATHSYSTHSYSTNGDATHSYSINDFTTHDQHHQTKNPPYGLIGIMDYIYQKNI